MTSKQKKTRFFNKSFLLGKNKRERKEKKSKRSKMQEKRMVAGDKKVEAYLSDSRKITQSKHYKK